MMENSLDNNQYMLAALREAERARDHAETPIGAVLVQNGRILARGHNQREARQDVTLHAEMIVIRKACARLRSWRLDGCDLYVTLEPCAMCAGAIQQARIRRVYFAATDPKAGAVVSILRYFDLPGLNHRVEYEAGLMADESATLLKSFFAWLRKKDRERGSVGVRRALSKKQSHGETKPKK